MCLYLYIYLYIFLYICTFYSTAKDPDHFFSDYSLAIDVPAPVVAEERKEVESGVVTENNDSVQKEEDKIEVDSEPQLESAVDTSASKGDNQIATTIVTEPVVETITVSSPSNTTKSPAVTTTTSSSTVTAATVVTIYLQEYIHNQLHQVVPPAVAAPVKPDKPAVLLCPMVSYLPYLHNKNIC